MYKNHPHQNIYFNFLAAKNFNEKFEMDFSGCSVWATTLLTFSQRLISQMNKQKPFKQLFETGGGMQTSR